MQVAGGGARGGGWHGTKPPISFAMKGSQEGRCFFVDFIFPLRKIHQEPPMQIEHLLGCVGGGVP